MPTRSRSRRRKCWVRRPPEPQPQPQPQPQEPEPPEPLPSPTEGSKSSVDENNQRPTRRFPYRLAVKKSPASSSEHRVNFASYIVPPPITNNLDESSSHQLRFDFDNDLSPTDLECLQEQLLCEPVTCVEPTTSSTSGKIKPIFIVLLSTVLATPALFGIFKPGGEGADPVAYERYSKFSQDMLQVQKQFLHQSYWLWHGLRITAWYALTEPLRAMPIALLMVIPFGDEHVGNCIASKAIASFNRIHNDKNTQQIMCTNLSKGADVHDYQKRISLAIRAARQAHQTAVLVDHIERLSNSSLPTLDKFLDLDNNQAENKLLIFTLYVPLEQCNPGYVRQYLIDAWISKVFARPTIARKLLDNSVYITQYDTDVKC